MANGLTEPKTGVTVRLTGCNDAFQILARVEKSLRQHGYAELSWQYIMEATESDFTHLMITTLEFVHVRNDQPDQGVFQDRRSLGQASHGTKQLNSIPQIELTGKVKVNE